MIIDINGILYNIFFNLIYLSNLIQKSVPFQIIDSYLWVCKWIVLKNYKIRDPLKRQSVISYDSF